MLLPEPEELNVEPENIPLDILYEDDDLLVVNKPKGMVVHPAAGHSSGTLVNAVLYHCRGNLSGINGVLRPGIVHRIDMDTTGALVICKSDFAHQSLAEQLSVHSITRKYRAIVHGNLKEDEGTVRGAIGRHPTDRKKMAINERNGKPAGNRPDASDPCPYGKYRASAAWRCGLWPEEMPGEKPAGTDAACDGTWIYPSTDRCLYGV